MKKIKIYHNKLGQKIPVLVLGWAGEDWPRNVIRCKMINNKEEFNVFKHQLTIK